MKILSLCHIQSLRDQKDALSLIAKITSTIWKCGKIIYVRYTMLNEALTYATANYHMSKYLFSIMCVYMCVYIHVVL